MALFSALEALVVIRALVCCSVTIALLSLAVPRAQAQDTPAPAASSSGAPAGDTNQTQTTSTTTNAPSSADATKQAKAASDAAGKVESAVANSGSPRESADEYAKSITEITGAVTPRSSTPLEDFRTLQKIIAAVQQRDLLNALTKAKGSLDPSSSSSLELARKTECDKLQQYTSLQQQDVADAQSKCLDAEKKAADTFKVLGTSLTNLQSALGGTYAYVANQVGALNDKLKPLKDLQPGATVPDLSPMLRTLPAGLVSLKSVLENQQQFDIAWKSTKPLLTQLGISPPAPPAGGTALAPDVEKQFSDLQSSVDAILPHIDGWFKAIAASLLTAAKSLDSTISDVAVDPAKNSAAAVGALRDQTDTLAGAQPVADAWPPLVGFLTDGKPSGFDLNATKKDFEALQTAMNILRGAVSRMHDALAGDMQHFETDEVSLYYFTDVPRLMRALNENTQTVGGVADAQARAAAQRTALMQTELDLADAQATVNRYQKEVLDLQEQQRQLQAKLKNQDSQVSKLASRLKGAQDAKDQSDAGYQNAQAAQQQSPNDPTAAGDLRAASAKQTAAATKLSQSQSDYNNAVAQRDATQSQLNDSQNQSDSLPAKTQAAKEALSAAQTAVAQDRRKMLMAAQGESDAFAFARDNTPFLYAPAVASSSDPAKRVILYAFNDNKTIFMRGKPDDLTLVKHIIAEFDRPAPQARLTLWTFQLSSQSDRKTNTKAAKKLNKAMKIIDEELGDARALVNTTLTLLRDLINEQVRAQAHTAPPQPSDACPEYGPADLEKLRRLNFFDPRVLQQLNFSMTTVKLRELRKLLPDPAGTTTLGEALLVLSLSRPATKQIVRKEFEKQIKDRLQALPLSREFGQPKISWRNLSADKYLPLTWHALGIWEPGVVGGTAGLSSSQLEISRALRTAYDSARLRQLASTLESWSIELASIDPRLDQLEANVANLNRQMARERLRLDARRRSIWDKSAHVVNELRENYGIDIGDLQAPGEGANETQQEKYKQGLSAAKLLTLKSPGLNGASPRVAAADQMLKEMVIAIEDDLARLFIQPMIEQLRIRLTSRAGVNVGVLQRESLLATNRGKARIDPRASAQLAVGTEVDILAGVQQLAQLYMVAQSGGALAALGALQAQPREPQPQIIALATGDKFEVTPVFDPSGQALRFKFDYVSTTTVQEPNGSTDPQFPRIDRHTVNTEVQLSNLETREISRFEVNARLGRPTEYWGGFPILKDIPSVRPWVPLLGWFVRKAGSNAVAQQSVIFGQTTIYPTIGALVDLLSDQGGADPISQQQVKQPDKSPGGNP